MKKSTKKLTAMLICAALAGISLAGCSNGELETKAPETTAAATTAAETKAATETKAAVKSESGVNMADANVKKKDQSKHYKFGYTCMDGTNPFFVTIEKTMREMVEAQGDELISVDPANDVTLQITQVEDLISQNIDAMFMNPAEAEGILPALE